MCPLAVWWGLRSPDYHANDNFVVVWTGGTNDNYTATNSGGLLPGFCRYTRSNVVTEGKRLFR